MLNLVPQLCLLEPSLCVTAPFLAVLRFSVLLTFSLAVSLHFISFCLVILICSVIFVLFTLPSAVPFLS